MGATATYHLGNRIPLHFLEGVEISTPALHAVVNSCSLAWGIPAMKLRKISGLMKELQEAIKTTKAYWPSLKQMRKNPHGKRDSRVGRPP